MIEQRTEQPFFQAAILWLATVPGIVTPSLAGQPLLDRITQHVRGNPGATGLAAVSAATGPAVQDEAAAQAKQTSPDAATPRAEDRPRLLADPFQTPQQLLRLLDIGPSDLDSFVDGQPIDAADEEAFLKILFRMPQIGADDIARWEQSPVPWQALTADPSARRADVFHLKGRARSVTQRAVRPQLAALFEMDGYYEVGVEVADGYAVTVCARQIPQAWQGRAELDEACQVSAMFVKKLDAPAQSHRFLFAAPRIGWLPDHLNRDLGIGPDQVLLGSLGMDIGLLDEVRTRNGSPISTAERGCFYALLRAAARATPAQMAQHAAPMQLARLLQQPEELQGDVLRVYGSVQRITRIKVSERDIARCFGIDHYFQLDVLVPLDGAEIHVKGSRPDEVGPVYRSNFPFTCCTLSIPPAWQPLVGQERASEPAVLDGFFFKMWSYSNPYVASFDKRQRQLSPMLILHEPQRGTGLSKGNRTVNVAVGAGFLLALAAIWVSIWRLNRADRQHARALRQRHKRDEPVDFVHLPGADD